MGQGSSHQVGLLPEDGTFLMGLQSHSRTVPLPGVTCSDVPRFFPPYLERPAVDMGNQVALLLTRLPGNQQRSGHRGSSGHSRVTAGRADCQSPASLQSCGNRATGPKGSTSVCSILDTKPQKATSISTPPAELSAGIQPHRLSQQVLLTTRVPKL